MSFFERFAGGGPGGRWGLEAVAVAGGSIVSAAGGGCMAADSTGEVIGVSKADWRVTAKERAELGAVSSSWGGVGGFVSIASRCGRFSCEERGAECVGGFTISAVLQSGCKLKKTMGKSSMEAEPQCQGGVIVWSRN